MITDSTGLKRGIAAGLKIKINGLDAVGHLCAGWCETTVYAGDKLALDMLSSGKFDSRTMVSWLTFYRVFRSTTPYDVMKDVLDCIEQNYRNWMRKRATTIDLVFDVYDQLYAAAGYNCFVMATKVAWLMRPAEVIIFDSQVDQSLLILKKSELISRTWRPSSKFFGLDGKKEFYREFDALMREIADQCEKPLDGKLALLPAQLKKWGHKEALPLANNRLRLLDKAMWIMGK